MSPMTEGEALAVEAGRKTLTDAALIACWEAKADVYERGNDLGEQMMAWQLRDCANELRSRAALAAPTAASAGEVAGVVVARTWVEGAPRRVSLTDYGRSLPGNTNLYTAPPAAVPADALERLVAEWRCHSDPYSGKRADELAALIPKGADHG